MTHYDDFYFDDDDNYNPTCPNCENMLYVSEKIKDIIFYCESEKCKGVYFAECSMCEGLTIHILCADKVYECLECSNTTVICPICNKIATGKQGEYSCCNQSFAICPKCYSLANPYDDSRYQCTAKEKHTGKRPIFTPTFQYELKQNEKEARRLRNNENLTIEEIAKRLDCSKSKVGRWLKQNKHYKTNEARIRKLVRNEEIIYSCDIVKMIFGNYSVEDIDSICNSCDMQKIEQEGKYCVVKLKCPNCEFKGETLSSNRSMINPNLYNSINFYGNSFIFYGETGNKKRLQCKKCKHIYTLKHTD